MTLSSALLIPVAKKISIGHLTLGQLNVLTLNKLDRLFI